MIDGNELTGSIPTESGSLAPLEWFSLGKRLFLFFLSCFETKQIRSRLLTRPSDFPPYKL